MGGVILRCQGFCKIAYSACLSNILRCPSKSFATLSSATCNSCKFPDLIYTLFVTRSFVALSGPIRNAQKTHSLPYCKKLVPQKAPWFCVVQREMLQGNGVGFCWFSICKIWRCNQKQWKMRTFTLLRNYWTHRNHFFYSLWELSTLFQKPQKSEFAKNNGFQKSKRGGIFKK